MIALRMMKLTDKADIRSKLKLICAYCSMKYNWIDHAHTRGFYEHWGKDCMFYGHKILMEALDE